MRVGVVIFPGSLDDVDATRAVRIAGGEAVPLWHGDSDLRGVDAVVLPGGFSYGDYLRCGAIARHAPVMGPLLEAAGAGLPVLGICNGFQVLCEARLLPGALLPNVDLRFLCREVELGVVSADSPFTRACEPGRSLRVPVKHFTGRFHAPPDELERLEAHGQIVLRYREGQNPNGSAGNVAGVSNRAGNVLGLMPHPEHAVDPRTGSADGACLFASVVEHVESGVLAAAA